MKTFSIIFFVGLTILGVQGNILTASLHKCSTFCPSIYSPLCATDGKTYTEFSNDCLMESANCELKRALLKPYVQTDMVWCTTKQYDNLSAIFGNLDLNRAECLRPCPMINQPICVANDKFRVTVASQCIMDTYNCVFRLSDLGIQTFETIKNSEC